MAAILPVAFKQADAALVYEPNFSLIAELNPQLKRDLVPLRVSPRMLPVLTCIPRYLSDQRREQLINIMLHIEQTPQGKQIMTLFGINGIQPFKPELLAPVERLLAEHDSLMAHLATKSTVP
jgi:ABC-type phosphate/phosphonate transport system substrate-binding protein